MIRLSADVSKKVPIPDRDYSSRSYMAGIEVEMSDRSTEQELRDRLEKLYALLESSVDTQIDREETPDSRPEAPYRSPDAGSTRRIRSRDGRLATEARIKAIHAIGRNLGLVNGGLSELLRESFGVERPEDLTVRDASSMIDHLKDMQQKGA